MKQTTKMMYKSLALATMLVGATGAMAAETVSVPASVTVNNAIDFTFAGTLNFGSVRAVADDAAATCAGLTMPANPTAALTSAVPSDCTTAGAGDAVIQAVGGTPSRPVFTIQGVAPFTSMKITLPTTTVELAANTGPNTPQFTISGFTAHKTSGTASPITLTSGAGTIATDATGMATFTVGATLGTHTAAITNVNYQDLTYTGSFDVSVDY